MLMFHTRYSGHTVYHLSTHTSVTVDVPKGKGKVYIPQVLLWSDNRRQFIMFIDKLQ